MEPARSIVESLGGSVLVAKELGMSPSGVCRWYSPIARGGCGGLVPSRRIPDVCKLARSRGRFLEPNMFFEGHMNVEPAKTA